MLVKGKYYSHGGKYRRSKIQMTDYDLTGYYVRGDQTLIDPVLKFIEAPDTGTTLYDILYDCMRSWERGFVADMEYQDSDEYILGEMEGCALEFYADGSLV
jgi:hypothetical protein